MSIRAVTMQPRCDALASRLSRIFLFEQDLLRKPYDPASSAGQHLGMILGALASEHHDFAAHLDPFVQVDHVLIAHADAP